LLDSLLQEIMMKLMLLTLLVGAAYSAPGHDIVKKSGNVPPRKFPMWHLEPLYVRKIPDNKQEKRSVGSDSESVSEINESHSVYSNVNGKENSFSQQRDQVAKNGELVSNIFHQEKGDKMSGGKPHFEKMTKVDIPEMNIHEQFMDNSQDHDAIRTVQKRMIGLPLPSAEELAKYILTTGDQQTVVQLIEALLEDGELSEEQALVYVDTVKAILVAAEKVEEEQEIREMLLQEAAEVAQQKEEEQRENALRNLRNGPREGPRRKLRQDLYKQLKGAW